MIHPTLPNREQALALFDRICNKLPSALPPSDDRPVVLYGAGKLGQMALEMLDRLGIPVAYALDRAPPPSGFLMGRLRVYRPEDAPSSDRTNLKVAVCVVLSSFAQIKASLLTQGWYEVLPFYDLVAVHANRLPLNNGWFAGALNDEDHRQIKTVLTGWSDDASRAAHLQFLAWRVLREEWIFPNAPVTIDDRYFIPELRRALNEKERFLDAGAWHGTISERFIEIVAASFCRIIAIEADQDNALMLRKWRERLPPSLRKRVDVLECALANHEGTKAFAHGHGLASRLMDGATGIVTTHTLDSLDLNFSVAKLHLEGGELAALRGGAVTLQKNRPILAVTTYHNRDGLWQTPAWLMTRLPDYRFLFRLHAWCGTGAVVYAIPVERQINP